MAALVPGYSFDIFISYRQKDNKYDGWVTEFVDNLHKELEATFKDDVSIFFDASPTHGLLETHDVDDSLREKLRCLVFIPIVSQTYCDPNAFAWKNELLVFKQLAGEDEIGLKVRLGDGNVMSRILPVVIHSLDADDRNLLERELGPIRSVDFVLRSSGVNRPLRAKDDDLRAGAKQPLYRDQVNKVANAVKELINSIRHPEKRATTMVGSISTEPYRRRAWPKIRLGITVALILALIASSYFYLSARYRTPTSVAVLPFEDMSPKHDQEWFADGLSEELINILTRIPSLDVKARTSSFAFKGKQEDIRTIAEKLGVTYVLEGSVLQSGDMVRITAKLIQADDGQSLWSSTFTRKLEDGFAIHDEIATAVAKALRETLFEKVPELHARTVDPKAVNFYLQGRYNTIHHHTAKAIQNYWAAVKIDSQYAKAWAGLAWTYTTMLPTDSLTGKEILRKRERFARQAYRLDPQDPDALRAMMQAYLGKWQWKEYEELAGQAVRMHPNNAEVIAFANFRFELRGQWAESRREYERAVKNDPLNYLYHSVLADSHRRNGDLLKAEESMKTALSLGRDVPGMWGGMADISIAKGDYATAAAYLDSASEEIFWFKMVRYYLMLKKGNTQAANAMLDSLKATERETNPAAIGVCYAYQKNYDSAFAYLQLARRDSSEAIPWLPLDLWLPEDFKKDKRFSELMKSVGLEMW